LPEDIGHFKVVIDATVDSKLGDVFEKEFKDSSKKVGENLEKEIEQSIEKSIRSAKNFERLFKIPSMGEISGKLASFAGESAKKLTSSGLSRIIGRGSTTSGTSETNKASPQSLADGTKTETGAVKGGSMAGMIAKIGILIGIVSVVANVLQSLAPIQAILKMISAVLQITLYPIAQFFLTIMKPIFGALLKYFIIPFYTDGLPILKSIGTGIGNLVVGLGKAVVAAPGAFLDWIKGVWKGITDEFDKFVTFISNGWDGAFRVLSGVLDWYVGVVNFHIETIMKILTTLWDDVTKIFTTLKNMIVGVFSGIWNGILKTIPGWLQKILGISTASDKDKSETKSRDVMISTSQRTKGTDVISGYTGRMEGTTKYAEGDMITTNKRGMQVSADEFIKLAIENTKAYLNLKDNFNIYVDGKLMESVAGTQQTPTKTAAPIHQAPNETYFPGLLQKQTQDIVNSLYPTWQAPWNNQMGISPYSEGVGSNVSQTADISKTISDTLDTYYGGVYSNLFNIPKYADGGIVNSPTIGLIGESGPEAIIPLNKMSNMGLNNKPNITINIAKIEKDVDVNTLIQRIERELYTNLKRGGAR
jgi:hypothetical protein